MKARAASARMLSMFILVSVLSGCASFPFFGKDADAEGRAPAEPQIPLYELEVRAPGTLRQLLLDYLDLARFQSAPASEAITPAELERLAAAAPAQARTLLETEGYFDAAVKVTRSDGAAGLPRIEGRRRARAARHRPQRRDRLDRAARAAHTDARRALA
jgi:translocation and assembly module TamA